MSTTAKREQHPFEPTTAGMKCRHTHYPEYVQCDLPPSDPIHTGTRPAPPELEFPCPPCSLCGEDTYHNGDCFRCDDCGAHWGGNGPGGWDEPGLPVCTSTNKPFDYPGLSAEHESIRHHVDHCIRVEGHDGEHRANEFSTWGEA